MIVRTRMAPSPTGDLHIGGLRTALYDYAWAKKNGGKFILRIEDTDRERLVPGATKRLTEVFKTYGLMWDEGPEVGGPFGPYIQSERLEIYRKYAEELVGKGHAYYCFCSKERLEELRKTQTENHELPRYDRHCRNLGQDEVKKSLSDNTPYVIRLKIPDNEVITFTDLVRGEISTNSSVLDDQVLLKSDGFPTYHLAVVVDDHLMEVTHIIRANEWIPSTPKHILLYRYFGWEAPKIAHLSVFLNPEGTGKMSKRKGTVSAQSFLDEGYLPEAMLNYLMLLGWNPGTERELFTLDEFTEVFDLKDLNKSNQKFTYEKLDWFNEQYIRKADNKDLAKRIKLFSTRSDEEIQSILPLVKERMKKLTEFDELTGYFFSAVDYNKELLAKYQDIYEGVLENALTVLTENWDNKNLEEQGRIYCQENNIKVGDYFMVLRIAISGRTVTPPLWDVMNIIGKDKSIIRLKALKNLIK